MGTDSLNSSAWETRLFKKGLEGPMGAREGVSGRTHALGGASSRLRSIVWPLEGAVLPPTRGEAPWERGRERSVTFAGGGATESLPARETMMTLCLVGCP